MKQNIETLKELRIEAALMENTGVVFALDELIAIRELKGSLGFVKDWEIDHSAGVPILLYKKCSVIESEQAYGLLNLIKQSELKGDQVPFSYYGDGAYYNTERAALKDGAEEVIPLYDHPQKPVVLPDGFYADEGWVIDYAEAVAAIESAGGSVKEV